MQIRLQRKSSIPRIRIASLICMGTFVLAINDGSGDVLEHQETGETVAQKKLDFQRMRYLSPAEKGELIKGIRDKLAASDSSDPFYGYRVADSRSMLLRLGDTETIEAVARSLSSEEMLGSDYERLKGSVLSARCPEIIPFLMPAIFQNEPFQVTPMTSDYGPNIPRSFDLAYFVVFLVSESPDFSESVRDWANKSSRYGRHEDIRSAVREWYSQNEDNIKNGRFGEVLPGRDIYSSREEEEKRQYRLSEERRQRAKGQVGNPNDSLSTPSPRNEKVSPDHSENMNANPPSESEHENQNYIIYILIGALAALAIGWYLTSRSSRR